MPSRHIYRFKTWGFLKIQLTGSVFNNFSNEIWIVFCQWPSSPVLNDHNKSFQKVPQSSLSQHNFIISFSIYPFLYHELGFHILVYFIISYIYIYQWMLWFMGKTHGFPVKRFSQTNRYPGHRTVHLSRPTHCDHLRH